MNNKITRIINTSARSVPNPLKNHGVIYQSFNWMDSDTQLIIDDKFDIPMKVYDFIDLGMEKGESIQVHSVKGMNRSVVQISVFLMMKFRWSVDKCQGFQVGKKKTIKLRKGFHKQLNMFEQYLMNNKGFTLTSAWSLDNKSGLDHKTLQLELLLTNTYQNAATKYNAEYSNSRLLAQNINVTGNTIKDSQSKSRRGVKWTQEVRRFIPKKKQITAKILSTNDKPEKEKSKSMSRGLQKGAIPIAKSEKKVKIEKVSSKINIANEKEAKNLMNSNTKFEDKTESQSKKESTLKKHNLQADEKIQNKDDLSQVGKLNFEKLKNSTKDNNQQDHALDSVRRKESSIKDDNSTLINNIKDDFSDNNNMTPIKIHKTVNKEILGKAANNGKTIDFENSFKVDSVSKDNTSFIKDKPSTSPVPSGNRKNPEGSQDKKVTTMKTYLGNENKKVNLVLVSNTDKKNGNSKRFAETESSLSRDINKSPINFANQQKLGGFYNTQADFSPNADLQNKSPDIVMDKKMMMTNNFDNNPEFNVKKPIKNFSYNSPEFFKKVDKFMKPSQMNARPVKTKEFKINTLNSQSNNRQSNTQASNFKDARSSDANHISVQGYNKNSMSKNRMTETPYKNGNNQILNMNFYNNSSYPGAKFLDTIENNKVSHINGKKIYFKTDTNFVKNKSQYPKDKAIKVNYGVADKNNDRSKFVNIDKQGESEFRPKTSIVPDYKLGPNDNFIPAADKVNKKKRPNSVKIMKVNDAQENYQVHSTYLTGQNKFKGGAFVGNTNALSIVKGQKQPYGQNHQQNGNIKLDPNRMNKYRDFMKKQKEGKKI